MKTKLQILIVVFSIVFTAAITLAQAVNPVTGLPTNTGPAPIDPTTGLPVKTVLIDPATGLPADGSPPFKDSSGAPSWIDTSWKDPDKVLSDVDFEQLPLSEVARQMRERFTNDFDIIIPNPNGVSPPPINPVTGVPESMPTIDPTQINVELQLKNVTASEIFSAMNLEFQLENTPVRWELTSNGSRPTVLLRYLPQLAPPPPPQTRKVFYVGDMIESTGTNNDVKLADIANTIYHALDVTRMPHAKIDLFPSGQLLIVSGTPDQVDLVEQTLRALKEKANDEKSHPRQFRY